MKLMKGQALLRITAADKQAVFFDEKTGLFKDIEQRADMGASFAQTVQSAEVLLVADDVHHIRPGDIAIVDYITETLTDKIVYQDEHGKIICVDTRTEYHDDDKIVYATLKSRQDMFVWSKGDVDQASLIYGVFRGDRLIPNPPYIICEHKEYQLTSRSGITYMEYEEGLRIRKVLVPNALSDPELVPGTFVVVEEFCLYEREMDGRKFDVIMDRDIEVAFE